MRSNLSHAINQRVSAFFCTGRYRPYAVRGPRGRWEGVRPRGHHANADRTSTGLGRVSRASSFGVRSPIHWLQRRHVSVQFSSESGEPPRDTGMISCTSPRRGCGVQPRHPVCGHLGPCLPATMLSVLSMGSRQSQQWVSRARTRLMSSLRRCPLARRGLPIRPTSVVRSPVAHVPACLFGPVAVAHCQFFRVGGW